MAKNSEAFNVSIFRALLKAWHCWVKGKIPGIMKAEKKEDQQLSLCIGG